VCWVVVGGWLSSARYCAALRAVPRYELSLALVVACRRGRPWLVALVGRSPSAFAALRPAAGARAVGGAPTRVGGWRVGLAVALGPGHAVGGYSSAPASLLAMAVAPLVVTKRRPPTEHSDHHQPVGDTLQLRVNLTSGRTRCGISHGASGHRPFLRLNPASGEVGAIQPRWMDLEGRSCSSFVSGGSGCVLQDDAAPVSARVRSLCKINDRVTAGVPEVPSGSGTDRRCRSLIN
jgi:hypothetical protein